MKAKLFLLGLCALALAACSIDETASVNDTNAISFKTTTATRATAATTNNIDAFTVWAWNTAGTTTSEFMKGVTAVKSGSMFITTPTYYWPGGTLDFYAFIPAAAVETDNSTDYNAHFGEEVDLTGDVIETANGSTYDTYKGYVANATITSPSAISFDTHVPTDAGKGIDLCYAVTMGQSSGTVGLNFRHALSQVAFKAMNGNDDWTVDIQGVTLCGIYKEGSCTLPEFGENGTTEHNSTTATKLEWTVGEVQGRFNAGIAPTKLDGATAISQSITAENGALMLIPQTVAAWEPGSDPTNTEVGAYIRINCKVTDTATNEQIWPNYNEADSTGESPEYAEITVPFDVDWEEGNLYTYTIVFGEGLGYYAPDDPNTDLDGTPVLVPIRFTVDIDDFGNTNGVDVGTDTGDGGDDEGGYDPASLVLEYTINSSNTEIQLPIASVTNAEIDWGDGETETTSSDNPSHTYSAPGTYTVSISGTVNAISSLGELLVISGAECLNAVIQWGDLGLTSMDWAFYNCLSLTSLPEDPGPFENVTTFLSAFEGCTSLKEVPEDLFKNCTEAVSFGGAFQGCTSLTAAPSFEGLSKVTYFGRIFEGCTSLTSLPENIFSGCTAVTDFEWAFYVCSLLKAVPKGIFSNCTEVTTFRGTFEDCASLEELPEGLFANCPNVTDFYMTFGWCFALKELPVGLFDNCRAVTDFRYTFYGCSSASGESPYTEIEVSDGVWEKVHLYERGNYPDYFTAPTSYNNCFYGCTKLDDYADIPSGWK